MGVVTSKTQLARQHETIGEAGFHRSWYPLCLSAELAAGNAIGRDFLGTRVVAWRDASGKPVVQSAWCPHLGADLSVGQVVEGRLRCAYHHWSFDGSGACAHIAAGDKIPSAARIFTYPVEEKWGLVWAFNGETPDFEVPGMPGATPETLDHEAQGRGERPWDTLGGGVERRRLPASAHPARPAGRLDARGGDGRCRRHRVPGREPLSPAARPHHRHQHLRTAPAVLRPGDVPDVHRRADRA